MNLMQLMQGQGKPDEDPCGDGDQSQLEGMKSQLLRAQWGKCLSWL
jgi:hypothetical protein